MNKPKALLFGLEGEPRLSPLLVKYIPNNDIVDNFAAVHYAQHMLFLETIRNPSLVSDDDVGLQNRALAALSPFCCHLKKATAAFPIFPPYFW